MSPPPGQALGKREVRVSCVEPSSKTRARSLETASRSKGTNEGKRHSNRTVEGRTELDLVQDEVDKAKRLLEEAHLEVQAAVNKVTEAAFRVGQTMEDMSQIRRLFEASLEPAEQ